MISKMIQPKNKKKKVYDGKNITVNIYDISLKNKKFEREIVEQNGASVVLAFEGKNVLLVKQHRFPHGYVLEVKNRSSMAAKKSLVVGACVIDSGYDGEVFIDLHNIGNTEQTIKSGDKIAQLVMTPVVHFRAMETSSGDLYDWYPITISDRGAGALGSTDKK